MFFDRARRRAAGLGLIASLVAGCGAGSGNTNSTGEGADGGGNSTTVTVSFPGVLPAVVAIRVGSGPLTQAALHSSSMSMTVPSGTTTYAVAYLCPPESVGTNSGQVQFIHEYLLEAAVNDGTSYNILCPTGSEATQTATLSATVDASAIPGSSQVTVDAQSGANFDAAVVLGTSGTVSLNAPPGSDRVDVEDFSRSLVGGQTLIWLAAAKTFQNQAVPGALNGGNPVILTSADETTSEPITFNGIPAGFGTPFLQGAFQPTGDVYGITLLAGPSNQYPVLPADMTQGGGTFAIQAQASDASNRGSLVFAAAAVSQAGPLSLTFPTAWSYGGPRPAGRPTFDFSSYSGFSGQSGLSYTGAVSWSSDPNVEQQIVVDATASFLNGLTSLVIQDLSVIPGFFGPPPSGTTETWTAAVLTSDAGPLQDDFLQLPAGRTCRRVETTGTFVVP